MWGAGGSARARPRLVLQTGPSPSHGEGLLGAGWKRWLTQDPSLPSKTHWAGPGGQSWKYEKTLALRALLGTAAIAARVGGWSLGGAGLQGRGALPKETPPWKGGRAGLVADSGPSKAPGCSEGQAERRKGLGGGSVAGPTLSPKTQAVWTARIR